MDIEELVLFYFEQIGKIPGARYKSGIRRQITQFTESGVSPNLIKEAIEKSSTKWRSYIQDHRNDEKPIMKPADGRNLLGEDIFYYHPALQIAPPPPVVTINHDGTFSESSQGFFLKIKESYTTTDIVEYFYRRFPDISRNLKRDIGAIEYVYNKAVIPAIESSGDKEMKAIDLLLFTIDTAAILSYDTDGKLKSPLDLSDYIGEGYRVYSDKKDACIAAGLNHVY